MWLLVIIGAIVIVWLLGIVLKATWRAGHCPDCRHRLSKLKVNQNGWWYKECPNVECHIQAISYEKLLEEK